eukprot:14914186-Ditylum_brightwellii.AAC.1
MPCFPPEGFRELQSVERYRPFITYLTYVGYVASIVAIGNARARRPASVSDAAAASLPPELGIPIL